nr:ABC transporter permease [Maribellus maritimus]
MIKIAGLSIGLTCFIAIMLWVKYETSYDKFHVNSDNLYRVAFTNENEDFHGYWQPGNLGGYLKETYPEIIESTNYSEIQIKISHENKGFYGTGSYADTAFFAMFTFPFKYGDPGNSLKNPGSVVLTSSMSQKLFGDKNSIGEMIKLNEEMIYTVTGVINDVPENSHMDFDFLIPFSDADEEMKSWAPKWTKTYILLEDNANTDVVNKKIAQVMNKFQPAWKNILYLVPMEKSHLYNLSGGGLIVYIILFSSMAVIIVLLACVNFMNLSTARSEIKQKEIFIRKVIGSKKSQLGWQFIFESMLYSFIATIIAVFLTILLLPSINNLLNTQLQINNFSFIPYLILLTAITGLIAGSYPAIYLSSLLPDQLGKRKIQSRRSRKWDFRYILVTFQFVISIFFIVSVLSIKHQINFIKSKDLGFNKENVIRLSSVGKLSEKAKEFKTALIQNPSIENVTVSVNNLTSWINTGPLDWDGRNKDELIEIGYNWVDYDFLQTFDLEMSQGRFFSREHMSDVDNALVINEKAADYLKLENPIGMKIQTWFGFKGTIVGVIKNFHTASLHEEIMPFALLLGENGNNIFIKTNGKDTKATLQFIQQQLKKVVPDDPFEYQFLEDQINDLYKTETLTSQIAGIGTFLAIFISCLGLFGLVFSTVERKIKEIGIRKTNGAKTNEVMFMLIKDFTFYVLIAFVMASPFAWYAMHKWLENFAYKTNQSWWIFVLAGLLALGIALLTVSWQSWRAATRNPVEALRYE